MKILGKKNIKYSLQNYMRSIDKYIKYILTHNVTTTFCVKDIWIYDLDSVGYIQYLFNIYVEVKLYLKSSKRCYKK